MRSISRISAANRSLLLLLSDPSQAASFTLRDWEAIVRTGRIVRLLASLRARMEAAGALAAVPEEVRRHLDSDAVVARHRRQMMTWQMATLAETLRGYGGPAVWLKGASYIAQSLPIAVGRLPSDVDLMVPRSRLDEVEALLKRAKWTMSELSAYDERYYRDWSHELPPMRHAGQPMELDLHHTILPVTGRLRPDASALIEASQALPESRFRVLSPEDQVLHTATQLFQDSDCNERLRDLVDLDGLIRCHSQSGSFWERLCERSALHGFGRPLGRGLRYCATFLRTPVPAELLDKRCLGAPWFAARVAMDWLIPPSLFPADPDFPATRWTRLARTLLLTRSQWLRMPPRLLAYHVWHKAGIAVKDRKN